MKKNDAQFSCESKSPSAMKEAVGAVRDSVQWVKNTPPVRLVSFVLNTFVDQDFTNWFAHGATELANMVLHGHPAPVYSRGTSPTEEKSDDAASQLHNHSPDVANSSTKLAAQPNEPVTPNTNSQDHTVHGVTSSDIRTPSAQPAMREETLGIVDQRMQEIMASTVDHNLEHELSR